MPELKTWNMIFVKDMTVQGMTIGCNSIAMALYCTIRYFDDFEAVVKVMSHSGNKDTGAAIGYDALPDFYKKDLEFHDVIIHVADDLYEGKVSKYH